MKVNKYVHTASPLRAVFSSPLRVSYLVSLASLRFMLTIIDFSLARQRGSVDEGGWGDGGRKDRCAAVEVEVEGAGGEGSMKDGWVGVAAGAVAEAGSAS